MAWGYNPFIAEKSPYHSAYLAVVESVAKLIATGAKFEEVYLSFQEYFEKPMKDGRRWGKPLAALLGAFMAQKGLEIAAIGGKDSVSGTFEQIDVPPTLVSFAVTTENIHNIISPEFKAAGHNVVLLKPQYDADGLPTAKSLKENFEVVNGLMRQGKVAAAYTPTYGGVAEAVMKMAMGNDIGFAFAEGVSLDDLFSQIQSGNMKELNIVVKADVQGSVEAVRQSLERLSNEEVRVRIIHGGVGAITESDVMLASASNAIIIGFNVRPEPAAKAFSDEEKVDVRLYRVIYNAIEDITAAMKGMLDPVYEEKVLGHAEVRQLFKASGVGTIAGSYVKDGKFVRNCQVRILRDSVVVYEGDLESLRRFKDDVKEVAAGYECGLVFRKFNDIKEGDWVEAFTMVEIPR